MTQINVQPKPKPKSFPSHTGPLGGADLRFNSPQPDTSRSCKSMDTGLVQHNHKISDMLRRQFLGRVTISLLLLMTWTHWIVGDAVWLVHLQIRNADEDVVVGEQGWKSSSHRDTLAIGVIWPGVDGNIERRSIERWWVRQRSINVILRIIYVNRIRDFHWRTETWPTIKNNNNNTSICKAP